MQRLITSELYGGQERESSEWGEGVAPTKVSPPEDFAPGERSRDVYSERPVIRLGDFR